MFFRQVLYRDLGCLHSLLKLGDHAEVWPAHVGGSLCGGAGLSLKTSSTIGYERRNNPLLSLPEQECVQSVARGTRAGWALCPHERIVIVADEQWRAAAMTRALHAVGRWRIARIALEWPQPAASREQAWSRIPLIGGAA